MDPEIKVHIDKLLEFMKEEAYKPLTVQELEEAFGIKDSAEFKDFVKALVAMEDQGLVVRTRSNRYGLPEKMNLLKGKLIGHAKGFAFVDPEDTSLDDVFIPPTELKTAMHGDIVLVRVSSKVSGLKTRRNDYSYFRTWRKGNCWNVYRKQKFRICDCRR